MRPNMTKAGKPRSRKSADMEDVLRTIERSSGSCNWRLARPHHISQRTTVAVSHGQLLYPFHVQHVQALQPPLDCERRNAFSEWLLQRDATLLSRMLLMDEACFTWNGILNTRSQHTWTDVNPHSFQETRFQQQLSINVWAIIIGDPLLGHYQLPPRKAANSSLQFLSEQLPHLLLDVPWNSSRYCGYCMMGLFAPSSRDAMQHSDSHGKDETNQICSLLGHPISLLQRYSYGAIRRASFTPNDATCGTSCGLTMKRLGRQFTACLTSFSGPGILGATELSYALTVMADRFNTL
jgi:hypothetical protein